MRAHASFALAFFRRPTEAKHFGRLGGVVCAAGRRGHGRADAMPALSAPPGRCT
ncbi:hypothetical protein SUDANB2_06099 [Streptomyces sp. enrichment culture]